MFCFKRADTCPCLPYTQTNCKSDSARSTHSMHTPKDERCSILSIGAVLLSHFAVLLMHPEGMHSRTQSVSAPYHCNALVIFFINSCTPLTAQKLGKLMVLLDSCTLQNDKNQDCIICIRDSMNQA